jgi:hypothetical protein
MAKKAKKKSAKKMGPKKGVAYFSTRALERAVLRGTKNEKNEAIDLLGYTVVEKNGWIVKEDADGHIVRISKVKKAKRPLHFVLD